MKSTEILSEFASVGELARAADCPLHRVVYAIQKLRIGPVAKVGGRCLYRREDLERVTAELAAIDARKIGAGREKI